MASVDNRGLSASLNVFGLLMCAAILAIGDWNVIRPLRDLQSALASKIDDVRALAARAATIVGRHSEVQQRLTAQEQLMSDRLARLPESLEAPKFLGQVSELARTNDVEVVQSRVGEPVEVETLTALDVYFKVVGSYVSLCRMFEELEALPRLCEVRHLHVQPAEPGAEKLTVEMTLRIFASRVEVAHAGSASYE